MNLKDYKLDIYKDEHDVLLSLYALFIYKDVNESVHYFDTINNTKIYVSNHLFELLINTRSIVSNLGMIPDDFSIFQVLKGKEKLTLLIELIESLKDRSLNLNKISSRSSFSIHDRYLILCDVMQDLINKDLFDI